MPTLVLLKPARACVASMTGLTRHRPGWVAAVRVLVMGCVLACLPLVVVDSSAVAEPSGRHGRAGKAAAEVAGTPLELSIESVSPPVLRAGRDIVITGTIHNTTTSTWTSVNVHPFRSLTPITDEAALNEAAASDPASYVGDRITDPGTFATIESLAPLETQGFTTIIPAAAFATDPGVYWIGVHAFGDSDATPRDEYADGRARTFISLLPRKTKPLAAALVLPLREPVLHDAEGRVRRVQRWTSLLSTGGRLHHLLEAGFAAEDRPVTWMVDPAVLVAVSALAEGNQGASMAATEPAAPPATPADPASPGAADPSAATGDAAPTNPKPPTVTATPHLSAEDKAAQRAAADWLELFYEVVPGHELLGLPYGDVDMSAAQRFDPELYQSAIARSITVFTELGLPQTMTLAPPSGYLSPEAVLNAPEGTQILVSDTAVDAEVLLETQRRSLTEAGISVASLPPLPTRFDVSGHPVYAASSGAAQGGPGPEPAGAPIAVRQRLLAEAALRSLSPSPQPLLLVPPSTWDPADPVRLFNGLDDGVRLTSLDELAAHVQVPATGPIDLPIETLPYPESEVAAELPERNIDAAVSIIEISTVLGDTLADPAPAATQLAEIGMSQANILTRAKASTWSAASEEIQQAYATQLGSISITGPRAATLSSNSGRIGATVVNGLDQAVVVRVVARTDDTVEVADSTSVRIAPHARRRLLLNARTSRPGIHRISLVVTTKDGAPLGSVDTFTIRSANFSWAIWIGLMVLFGVGGTTFLWRSWRRWREVRRDGHWPDSRGEHKLRHHDDHQHDDHHDDDRTMVEERAQRVSRNHPEDTA